MAERARLMSGGHKLTAIVDRFPVGIGGAMDWGLAVHDPRIDSDRDALSTLRMTSPGGERLVWNPWNDVGALTVSMCQTYFP